MDFETVDKFVTAAQAAGITIYGHTLAWHAQQNNKYLNSLIKDKRIAACCRRRKLFAYQYF